MLNIEAEIIKNILPDHYKVTPKDNRVHCVSEIGIKENVYDAEWKKVFKSFKKEFGSRFGEVYHNTCTNHVDFSVYIDPNITA